MNAYHFVAETLRDGRPIPPIAEWLVHEGEIEICKSGLHFSLHPFDAFSFSPSEAKYLCLVEVEDVVETESDKGVCRRRKIITRIECEELLRSFARWCALQVIHLWDAPPVVREWVTGNVYGYPYDMESKPCIARCDYEVKFGVGMHRIWISATEIERDYSLFALYHYAHIDKEKDWKR